MPLNPAALARLCYANRPFQRVELNRRQSVRI
jgi:hypothetical protein